MGHSSCDSATLRAPSPTSDSTATATSTLDSSWGRNYQRNLQHWPKTRWHRDQPTPSSSPSPPTPNPLPSWVSPFHTAPQNAPKPALTRLIGRVLHTFPFPAVILPSPEGTAAHLLPWGAHCWPGPHYANECQWCCTVSNVFATPPNGKPRKRCHS